MKPSERIQAQRLAQRHEEFLARLGAERAARAEAEQRARAAHEAKVAELREQKRRERQTEAARLELTERERIHRAAQARAARVRKWAGQRRARERTQPPADLTSPRPRVVLSTARPLARRIYRLAKPAAPLRPDAPPRSRALRTERPRVGERSIPRRDVPVRRPPAVRIQKTDRLGGIIGGQKSRRPAKVSRAGRSGQRVYKIAKPVAAPRPAASRATHGIVKPAAGRRVAPPSRARQQAAPPRVRRAAPAKATQQPERRAPQRPARVRAKAAAPSAPASRPRAVVAGSRPQAPVPSKPAVRDQHSLPRAGSVPPSSAPAPAASSAASTALAPPGSASVELPENLLWLRVQDGYVVDGMGRAVNMRGVDVAGFDTVAPGAGQTLAEALSLDDANLTTIVDLWGISLVRVSFRAQTVLAGNDVLSSGDVLSGLDDLVSAAADAGAYILLAQQAPAGVATPDAGVLTCWQALASRYADEPAVLFELFASDFPLAGNWLDVALMLVGVIRKEHPASLVFVGNGSGGPDIAGLPLRFSTGDPVPNIVYTVRVDPQHLPNTRDAQLAGLTDAFPLVASQWSNGGSGFDRSSELAAGVFGRYGIGWFASSWNAPPRLVGDAAGHDFSPTAWGLTVLRALSAPAKPRYVRFLSG